MNTLMSLAWTSVGAERLQKSAAPGRGWLCWTFAAAREMLTRELAVAVGPGGRVTGIDFSENMLNQAEKNLRDFPHKDIIDLVQGDALSMPFEDDTFDGAAIGWGLRNLPDVAQGISEMRRVVKPGAMVVSIDMGKTEIPVFKQFYWLYFEKLVPLMGRIWGSGRDQYRYLYESAYEFYSQGELVKIFQDCGLSHCRYLNLALGSIAVVYGQKPAEN
jgi:demethylmenaquinone methyltransferase/2-methoxy-6-polyprenyl-1,4-benzoquinol methylase